MKKGGVAPLFRFDMPCADASGAHQDKSRPCRSAISKLSFDIEANCKERDVFDEALRKETKISRQNGSAPKVQGKRAKRQEKHVSAEASYRSNHLGTEANSDQKVTFSQEDTTALGFDVRYF